MVGGSYNETEGVELWPSYKGVTYEISASLSKSLNIDISAVRSYNMLPWLSEHFNDANIIAVGTTASIAVQKAVMQKAGMAARFPQGEQLITLESEHNFEKIFATLGQVIEAHQDVIVDISHSFRHIPILMTVQMLIENISSPSKIKHILFAKEEEKERRYTIIDLRRYLDLAGISYALASFKDNYTISKTVQVIDPDYRVLLQMLSTFGEQILANSFEELFLGNEANPSLANKIMDALDAIETHPDVLALRRHIRQIRSHIQELTDLTTGSADSRYYGIGRMMMKKGYLLNAITLLDEAIAGYCLEGIRNIDAATKKKIALHEEKIRQQERYHATYNQYELVSQAKNMIKHFEKNNRTFLNDESLHQLIIKSIDKSKTQGLRHLIYSCDNLRNDLAHGNTYKRYTNVQQEIEKVYKEYAKHCLPGSKDPLRRFKS